MRFLYFGWILCITLELLLFVSCTMTVQSWLWEVSLELYSLLKDSTPHMYVNSSVHKSLSKLSLSQVSWQPLSSSLLIYSSFCSTYLPSCSFLISIELVAPLQNSDAITECVLGTLDYFMYLRGFFFFFKMWPDYWHVAMQGPAKGILIFAGP